MHDFLIFLPEVPVAGAAGRGQLGPTRPAALLLHFQALCSWAGVVPSFDAQAFPLQFGQVTGWKGGEAP